MRSLSPNSLLAFSHVNLTKNQAVILEAFTEAHTDQEIAEIVGWPINRISGRCGELLRLEKIIKVGDRVVHGSKC